MSLQTKSTTSVPVACQKSPRLSQYTVSTYEWEPEDALHRASTVGNLDLVQAAIHAGADVNGLDDKGCSALMLATLHGHSHIIDFLLDAGALIEVMWEKHTDGPHNVPETDSRSNEIWQSAATVAAACGYHQLLKRFIVHYDLHLCREGGECYGEENPLLAAAHYGRLECVQILLDNPECAELVPEALEHTVFPPICFSDDPVPQYDDIWWMPKLSHTLSLDMNGDELSVNSHSGTSAESLGNMTREKCRRKEVFYILPSSYVGLLQAEYRVRFLRSGSDLPGMFCLDIR